MDFFNVKWVGSNSSSVPSSMMLDDMCQPPAGEGVWDLAQLPVDSCNVCGVGVAKLVLTLVAMSSRGSNEAGPKQPTVLDERDLSCIMGVYNMLMDI